MDEIAARLVPVLIVAMPPTVVYGAWLALDWWRSRREKRAGADLRHGNAP
jgi:hypothetical protein